MVIDKYEAQILANYSELIWYASTFNKQMDIHHKLLIDSYMFLPNSSQKTNFISYKRGSLQTKISLGKEDIIDQQKAP